MLHTRVPTSLPGQASPGLQVAGGTGRAWSWCCEKEGAAAGQEISLPASGIGLKHLKSQHHCWGSYGCWPNTARGRNPGGRAPILTRGLFRGSHQPAHAQGLPTQQGLYPSTVPMLLMVPPSLCHKQIPVPQADPHGTSRSPDPPHGSTPGRAEAAGQ